VLARFQRRNLRILAVFTDIRERKQKKCYTDSQFDRQIINSINEVSWYVPLTSSTFWNAYMEEVSGMSEAGSWGSMY
jgi:hypothetical protein